MKRHMTASTVGVTGRNEGTPRLVTARTSSATKKEPRPRPPSGERRLALASSNTWMHTLIPTGELSHGTAAALEAEIERLCEEGVTSLTLDLRELRRIDSTGVAVIAFRAGLCRRRGHEFTLIAGSEAVQHAFEQAGIADALPFQADQATQEVEPRHNPRPARRLRSTDR